MNIFYLHRSPQTVARWLDERDAVNVRVYSQYTLSNALQLYCGENLPLRQFDDRYWSIHMDWIMQSIEHALWVLDLYLALTKRSNRKEDYLLERFFYHYIDVLPHTGWKNPPLTMPLKYALLQCDDIEKWRLFYGLQNRPWKKVKRPFWCR